MMIAGQAEPFAFCCCGHRQLPHELRLQAAWDAAVLRPANAPGLVELAYGHPPDEPLPPESITFLKGKFWPNGYTIKMAFQGGSPRINAKVIEFANHWSQWANISFIDVGVNDNPDILASYDQEGYWSYIGTDCRMVVQRMRQPCFNLQGFDSGRMPESEWYRVVEHEAGHAIGALHEQMRPEIIMRIDREKCYEYFQRTQGWNRQMVDEQVLTQLDMASVFASTEEDTSVMMYSLPSIIMKDSKPVIGGNRITELDGQTVAKIYPGKGPVHPKFRDFSEAL